MTTQTTQPRDSAAAKATRLRAARIISWVLVFACAVFIFAASAHTGNDLDQGNGPLSQVKRALAGLLGSLLGHEVDVSPIGHFTEYLIFGALLMNAFRLHVPHFGKALACSWIVAALYAASDEFHQMFVPGRACDPADWVVDVVATLIGAAIVGLIALRPFARRAPSKNEG